MITPAEFDRHLMGAMGILAEHAGDAGLVAECDGVAITAVGRGPDEFNTAWLLDVPTKAGESLAWAHAELVRRPPPFMVQVPAPFVSAVHGHLRGLGLDADHHAPGMVRAATNDVPLPPSGLRIEQVRDAAALRAHVVATAIGFGAPDPTAMNGLMPPSLLDDDRVALFNGHVDGGDVPSATSVSVVCGGVAGVYAVTVHETARRRGFGTAMTFAAMAAGAKVGVDAVALQASDMGQPVYARMGFTEIRRHHRYRPVADC